MVQKEATAMFIGHRECYEMDRQQLRKEIICLIEKGVTTFLSGGMGQFDAVCEGIVADLKSIYPHVELFIIAPYVNFKPKHTLHADLIVFPDGFEQYHPKSAIQHRNRYMADRSSFALCYVKYSWGGAAQTLAYVKKQGIACIDIPDRTLEDFQ